MNGADQPLSELEQHLLNDFQHNMPLSTTPYADMARQLCVSEEAVMESMRTLQANGYISRVGPVFRPNKIGVSTLAAMSVPAQELELVANIISAFPEVNHNYERDHTYNLWFVVTAANEQQLNSVLHEIELQTQYSLMSLPMLENYFIDLGFDLKWAHKHA